MKVITIPLKPEKWQTDILYRRMNLCASLYNRLADEFEAGYRHMKQEIEYRVAINTINEIYMLPVHEQERQKKTRTYRAAVEDQTAIHRKYHFSAYSFNDRTIALAAEYRDLLPSRVATYTIARPLWKSFHNYLYNRVTRLKRKSKDMQTSLTSDGRSGIRLIDETGVAQRGGVDIHQKLYVIYGRSTGKRVLKIPVKIDPKDTYREKYLRYPMRWISIAKFVDHRGRNGLIARVLVDDEAEPAPPAQS